jgi:membrane protease YdiL (CAAX protease family)
VGLTALIAIALWEKVRERVPYLLDPVESPPPRLAMADGLIAVLAFVALQTVVGFVLSFSGVEPGTRIFVAFTVAGALVALGVLFALRRVPGLLRITGLRVPRFERRCGVLGASLLGVAGGLATALFAAAYLLVIAWLGLMPLAAEQAAHLTLMDGLTRALLAVVAAPLVEELMFRGVLFRGMQRSFRPWVAVVLSAAVFAAIHPPLGFIPVFTLGVVAALSFRRTGLLLTPIVAHAVYNFVIVVVLPVLLAGA